MLINLLAFIFLIILLCGGIWFWINKNSTPDSHPHHSPSPSGGMGMPMKEQTEGQFRTKQSTAVVSAKVPAAAPSDAEDYIWKDRRLSERWRDWLALTTTIIAVLTVGMSLQVSQYITMSLISQGKETNAWSYYQAKSMKEHNVIMSKATLELQFAANPAMSAEAAEKYRKTIKRYDDEIKRYKDEREEIQQQAESLGKNRDKANKSATGFNNSLAFLQVAIVLSSIATMVRKKYIWYISLASLTGWLYFLIRSF